METLVKYAVQFVEDTGREISIWHYPDYLTAVIEELKMRREAPEYDRRSTGEAPPEEQAE